MMFKTHWPAISFLVILAVAVGAQIIAAAEPSACYPGSLLYWSSEQKVPLFHCWEFWFNRYQTFIAAILALIAAYFSVNATRQQTNVAVRANQNEASVVAYIALRKYQNDTLDSLQTIIDYDRKMPLGWMSASTPRLDIAGDQRVIAHLPGNLARDVFSFERATAGARGNMAELAKAAAPLTHLYVASRMADLMLRAEALAERVGTITGIYEPTIGPDIWADIRAWRDWVPLTLGGEETASWLKTEYHRRQAAELNIGLLIESN